MKRTDSTTPGVTREVQLSPCGTYRYWLTHNWGTKAAGRALFVMLNPSKADATTDDPTIRRCAGYARAWSCGGFAVANLFAYRATRPRDLFAVLAEDPARAIGKDNDWHIRLLLDEHRRAQDRIVVAWGSHGSHKDVLARRKAVLRMLPVAETLCLEVTGTGDPRHPLMARSSLLCDTYPFPASAWDED